MARRNRLSLPAVELPSFSAHVNFTGYRDGKAVVMGAASGQRRPWQR